MFIAVSLQRMNMRKEIQLTGRQLAIYLARNAGIQQHQHPITQDSPNALEYPVPVGLAVIRSAES